jgi:hypothetical protein
MNKATIIFTLLLIAMLWIMLTPASRLYWDNIGYTWDKLLNPVSYIEESKDDKNL